MIKHFLTFITALKDRPVYLDPDAVEAVYDAAETPNLYATIHMQSGRNWVVLGRAGPIMGQIAAARTGGGTGERRAAPAPAPGPEPPPELAQEFADVVGTMRETAEKLMAAGGIEPMLDRLIVELGDRLDRRETHVWKRFAAELAKRARKGPEVTAPDLTRGHRKLLEDIATLAETASIYGPVGDLELEVGRFGRMVAVCEAARCYTNMVRGGDALAAHLSGRLGTCWDRLQEALFALHMYPDPEAAGQHNAQSTKPAAGGRSHTVRMEAVTLTPEQSAELAPILKRIEAEDRAADEAHPRGDLGELATILFDLNAAIPDVGKPWAQELHDGVARARAWLARTPDSLQGRAEGGSDA